MNAVYTIPTSVWEYNPCVLYVPALTGPTCFLPGQSAMSDDLVVIDDNYLITVEKLSVYQTSSGAR